jgi:hypothetical protein
MGQFFMIVVAEPLIARVSYHDHGNAVFPGESRSGTWPRRRRFTANQIGDLQAAVRL